MGLIGFYHHWLSNCLIDGSWFCSFIAVAGVSGGILRDILCNDVPLVFRRELYASISFVAVICYWVFGGWIAA